MSTDEQHVALPKLYGAPAYARPTAKVDEVPRPFDPDDLPIAAAQTDDERQLLASLPARAYAPGGGVVLGKQIESASANGRHELRPRPFGLRALAGRLLGGDS